MESKQNKINFIQRNRQNIGRRKAGRPSVSASTTAPAPSTSTEHKEGQEKERVEKSVVRKHYAETRPASSSYTGPRQKRTSKPVEDFDLVTKMIRRNLFEQLLKIFLPMDSGTLTACREVCKSWNKYFKLVFWREIRVRTELEKRLEENWRNKRYYKVQLEIVSGVGCKMKCKENFRPCQCGDWLECEVVQDNLVLQFGGTSLGARYSTTDLTASSSPQESVLEVEEKFGLEQFQLRFSLKAGLELEMKNWLSSPVFVQKSDKNCLKATTEKFAVERHPGDATMILIRDRRTKEVLARVRPHTGLVSTEVLEVTELKCHNRWLAVNLGGCVCVYSLDVMARGNSAGALLLLANKERRDKENVHYFYISDNFLLTVSNCTITLYDFWRYKIVSSVKDFIL